MNKKIHITLISIIGLIISSSLIMIVMSSVSSQARATLVSPRFGAPIQGCPTQGYGKNTTVYLEDTIKIWVAPDPAEAPIPSAWKKAANWYGALLPSALPTANCTPLIIKEISLDSNPLVLFGGDLDTNSILPTAVALEFYVPANIAPVLYNIAIGFQEPLTPTRQISGEINLIPTKGSWQGVPGSAAEKWMQVPQKFIITEPNCIIFPWAEDARATDSVGKLTMNNKSVNPFSFMHVTDTHYTDLDTLGNNSLWEMDSQVLAPNVIIHTGDVTDDPGKTPSDYDLAYDQLIKLNSPVVMSIGNHDHKLGGPWRYFFGPLFSVTRFDTVTFINFDPVYPLGSGLLQWIDSNAKKTRALYPTGTLFYSCHYYPTPDYFSGGWLEIVDSMSKYNVSAYLTGHSHVDLVGSFDAIIKQVVQDLGIDNIDKAIELPNGNRTTYLDPISEPTLLMTRSSGGPGETLFKEQYSNFTDSEYAGYRRVEITNNFVSNYTYDYNGDGIRDPQVSIPNGRFNVSYIEDIDLGIGSTAGKTWCLKNNMNDYIPAARAIFELPAPPVGMTWDLTSSNKTNGAYIRTYLSDGIRYWIDVRVPIVPHTDISLKIEPTIGGII